MEPHFIDEETGSERLSSIPNVKQQLRGRADANPVPSESKALILNH